MITSQQFLDAVADFESCIREGLDCENAIAEAAEANGLDQEVFVKRLSRETDLNSRVELIQRRASQDRFFALAKLEIAKCKNREGDYAYATSGLGFLGLGAEEKIAEAVGKILARPLTEHETWIIEELWNPWFFEVKRESRTRMALRKQQSGAD